jgi:hypothetical protein
VRWLVAGTHTLRVTLGSTPVAGSPFLVHVAAAAVDSMQCVLLHPPASLVCGEPHSLQLQVRLSSLSPLSRLLSPLPSLHSLSLSVSLSLSPAPRCATPSATAWPCTRTASPWPARPPTRSPSPRCVLAG